MATVFSGGVYVNTTFTGAVRSDFQANLKTQLLAAGWTNVAQAAGQGPGNVGAVTISIASPGVVTWPGNHGFLGGERIMLQVSAGGALPTGLSVNTLYFVKYVNATTHRLATTLGGADINTSGSQSGTITLNTESMLLQSATQANVTNPIRVRLLDLRTTTLRVDIENQAGTVKSSNQANSDWGGHLLPGAAKTYRVIATQFHFICFTPGVSAAREFVMAGMPWVPPDLASVTDIGYMFSNGTSDSSTSICDSLRTIPSLAVSPTGNMECLYNTNFFENQQSAANSASTGFPALPIVNTGGAAQLGRAAHYRWANDIINTSDLLVSWGLTALTDEGKIKGQMYDLVFIADAFAVDSTDTFNSHTWWNLTGNNAGTGGSIARGGVWVATS